MSHRRKRKKLLLYFLTVAILISFLRSFVGVEDFEEQSLPSKNTEDEFEEEEIEINHDEHPDKMEDEIYWIRRKQEIEERETYHKPQLMMKFDEKENIITLPNKTYNLPVNCPPNFQPKKDIIVLDTMRHCGPEGNGWIPEFECWSYTKYSECGGRFVGYNNEFAVMSDVVIDTALVVAKGNPKVENHLEYMEYGKGFFNVPWCESLSQKYSFSGQGNHLNTWIKVVKSFGGSIQVSESRSGVTIAKAVARYEYYNLYHTVIHLYNTFLVLNYLRKDPVEARILFIDRHLNCKLSDFWRIFKEAEFISSLPRLVHLETLIWGIPGQGSPILSYHDEQMPPLLEDFHDYVLKAFSVTEKMAYNCSSLKVTIISRKNYIASPHNPSEVTNRKIANEKELLISLRNKFRTFDIVVIDFESYSITDQLKIIADTDILVGMHCAVLTHMMFLPKHSAVIELFPHMKKWSGDYNQYKRIAKWRELKYIRWRNTDVKNETEEESTKIPPYLLNILVSQMFERLCHKKKT